MYPITRESVMVVIISSVAEKAVCWCDGRKKRSRRILRRLTHLAAVRVGTGALARPNRSQLGRCRRSQRVGLAAERRLFAGEAPASTRFQARPSSTYLNYIDLRVDLRFTSAALPLHGLRRTVLTETESLWLPHLQTLRSRLTLRLWRRLGAPGSGRLRGSTKAFWLPPRSGRSSGWPSACLSGSIPTT